MILSGSSPARRRSWSAYWRSSLECHSLNDCGEGRNALSFFWSRDLGKKERHLFPDGAPGRVMAVETN